MSTTLHAPDPTTRPDLGGRHPVRVGHLGMGLAFLCFAAAWALVQGDVVGAGAVRWLLPVPWLVGGAAGLAVIAARSLRRGAPTPGTDTHTDTATEGDLR